MDYLGELGARLRDLQGYTSLAYELIQNAEDSGNASYISFNIRQDELVVDNDGVFSDCGTVEKPDCPWKTDPARGHMCDFHRFRLVAGGDKREQRHTIGAFGIGFTSVYQITDEPNVISHGRHWIVHEEKDEKERIAVCPGCAQCQTKGLPGTRFILPWATEADSDLRRALRADSVAANAPTKLLKELVTSLPNALLFLSNIQEIQILNDGILVKKVACLRDGNSLVVDDGTTDQLWFVFRGNFDGSAEEMKAAHHGRIEDKRSADVAIAIASESIDTGLLYAFLPSQHSTGLQFHINADFYPASDRKRVNFEAGYELEWNAEAIRAAAQVLSDSLEELPKLLTPKQLWRVIASCNEVSKTPQRPMFSEFWDRLLIKLKSANIVFTTTGHWASATDSRVILEDAEHKAVKLLGSMGIILPHEDLRPFLNQMREIGVGLVDIVDITGALVRNGLSSRVEKNDGPSWIRSAESLALLWDELGLLLRRRRDKQSQKKAENEVLRCAIAPGHDGALWPCGSIYSAEQRTALLFGEIDSSIPFLDKAAPAAEELLQLIPRFTAKVAIERIANLSNDQLLLLGNDRAVLARRLLRWFESRRDEILPSPTLSTALVRLPIFPTASGPKPLSGLALPGGFTDSIGIASLVDSAALEGRTEFLRDLGAQELTFEQYALMHVPQSWVMEKMTPEVKRQVTELLALKLGEIRDNDQIRNALQRIDLAECSDGSFQRASNIYFSSDIVHAVLGDVASYARYEGDHAEAIGELYTWLGTLTEPSLSDVIARIETLTSVPPSQASKNIIEKIVGYLGNYFARENTDRKPLGALKLASWLPGRNQSTWYKPSEVFTIFREALFASQPVFLGLPAVIQRNNARFLEFIGVHTEPSVRQVVDHLMHCSANQTPVNMEVYRFLNDNAEDPIIPSLINRPCLILAEKRYVEPHKVFWGPHPFGRLRIQLVPEWRKYNDLLKTLNVRESPEPSDAITVISEIAEDFGRDNRPLEDWAYSALMSAWKILDVALFLDQIDETYLAALTNIKVIPNSERVLQQADAMLFEDRSGLAGKFGSFLATSAIPRPSESWMAMAAAGVRTLSKAVNVEIVECVDPVADDRVSDTLRSRSLELSRVLDVQMGTGHADSLHALLEGIRCERISGLSIRFTINAFNRVRHSPPEDIPAHYQVETKTLYLVEQNGRIPWTSIARELALALFPEEEPGRLAPGFKEVLSAESDDAARATLDELGFASVQIVIPTEDSETVSGDFGAEETDEEFASDESTATDESATPQEELTPDEAAKQMLGDLAGPTALPPELVQTDITGSSQPGSQTNGKKGTAKSQSRKQGRLRSYVIKGDGKSTESNGDSQKLRTEVDKAGIECVKLFEKAQGRNAEVKAHSHEGYDIESKDDAGNIVRYIEVKSLSGVWGTQGVSVHRSQFKFAQQLGAEYWLYIVENALSADPVIYRIPDPARKVDDFLFDYDWHEIAEGDDTNE
jgi:hypothetical protein